MEDYIFDHENQEKISAEELAFLILKILRRNLSTKKRTIDLG